MDLISPLSVDLLKDSRRLVSSCSISRHDDVVAPLLWGFVGHPAAGSARQIVFRFTQMTRHVRLRCTQPCIRQNTSPLMHMERLVLKL